jgi:phosphate transport system substrate-binding protein
MIVRRRAIGAAILALAAVAVAAILVVAYLVVAGGSLSSGGNTLQVTTQQSGLVDFSTPLELKAGGSSFVNPLMQTWIFAFQNLTHGQITDDYEPLGSGAGISGIFAGLYDFAGSDAPVPPSYLNANASGRVLLQIPEALGGVAVFYNIPGVTVSLNMSGKVLEGIYLQNITKWNDPAIAALNPKVALPDQTIVPVHRSDGSGTTYALTTYFSKIDPTWAKRVGVGTSVNWPNTPNPELASKGSGGVAALVNGTAYSIGYADSFYAFANGLNPASIENSAGVFLKPSIASVAAAAAAFSTQLQQNATFSITDAPGAASYPISTFTYLLVWQSQSSPQKADAMVSFFWWVIHDGQSYSSRLSYAPLPPSMVTVDEGLLHQINYNGQTYVP